jgi:hypothetical protein
MTNERRYVVTIDKFATCIGMRFHFNWGKKMHDENVLTKQEMCFMYMSGGEAKPPSSTNFALELVTLHRILRKTLAPREGDATVCLSFL